MESEASPGGRRELQGHGPDPEQEAKARRQAQLDQRHLEAYWNMHRLRDSLYGRYAALLKDKVLSQRSQLQQRHETARAKSEDTNQKKQKKLAFSKLQHNDSYLKPLPKSSYYLIFDLQRQLAERGRLKTHHELEDFYRAIEFRGRPSQLQRSLEAVRRNMLESRPAADLITSEERRCTDEEKRREENISNFRSLHREPGSRERPVEMILCGNQEKDGCESMFPEMKAPTFATLQPDFMRSFQSTMPNVIIPETPKKSRKAEIYSRRLRQMHDLCLSNMAFSQRLLDREADSLSWQEGRGGDPDLMLPGIDPKHGKTNQTNMLLLCTLKQPGSVQNSRPASPKQPSRKSSISGHRRSEPLVGVTAPCSRKPPDPLSIEDLCQQKSVEIIDRGFTFWRNYTHY
ncbi:uncharacterized protein si:ch211-130h14.4 [Labrus bergylta]|uniref:uncharacterized protein si:ch211-130h14.4 n=1 Tax=Labrus bergylta TaxID=56723 RepID=UPI003313AA47